MRNRDSATNTNVSKVLTASGDRFSNRTSDLLANVQEASLFDYWRMLIKRGRMILYAMLVVFSLVAVVTLKLTRQYEAVGRIIVSRDNGDVVADQITQQAGGSAGGGDLNSEIETQANILQSDTLALHVIQDLKLYQEPDFAGSLAMVNYDNGTTPLGTQPDMDPQLQEQMLKIFKRDLVVLEVPNTRLIEIHFFSSNAKLAAATAKRLAETLEDRGTQARYEATTHATDWLASELNDLKHQVEQSEQALVEYQKKAGIVGLDDKQNTIMSKLDDLNHALTLVENDRSSKQANFESIKSVTPELSAAVPANSQIYKLRQQQTDLKSQYAQTMAQFGDQYPKALAIANQLKELQAAIADENKRIATEVESDYKIAKSREKSLNDIFEQQKQSAIDLSERSVEYRILERDANSYRDLYESLTKTLKQAEVLASLQSSNISVVDEPVVPSHPTRPNIPRNLALGLVLGLACGIASAFIAEMLDNRLYRPEEISAIADLPVLVSVPFYGTPLQEGFEPAKHLEPENSQRVGLVSSRQPRSQWAEAYRALRTAILLSSSGAPPRLILVTSGVPQEGKSTTSVNLATVLSQRGTRVLLIDADLRRPSIHKILGVHSGQGLSTVLTGTSTLNEAVVVTSVPDLAVLPAGPIPPSPSELLGSDAMKALLSQCAEEYEFVILDAPPVLPVTDSVILSTEVDAVIYVVRAGSTTKHCVRRSREVLAGVGARVLGVVVNALSTTFADSYYYYGKSDYAPYYASDDDDSADDGARKPVKA